MSGTGLLGHLLLFTIQYRFRAPPGMLWLRFSSKAIIILYFIIQKHDMTIHTGTFLGPRERKLKQLSVILLLSLTLRTLQLIKSPGSFVSGPGV